MRDARPQHRDSEHLRGFTLIELVLVLVIVGLAMGLAVVRLGTLDHWREQAALRKLTDTIVLLNNQAVLNQVFYRMEFDLEKNQYRVGAMRPEDTTDAISGDDTPPILQLELANVVSPAIPDGATMLPPPGLASLAEPITLPGKMVFLDVATTRGKITRDDKRSNPFLMFSPRGFSEFGVIHISMGNETPITIMVNPWTGLAEVYTEYKDFEYTLNKRK
jgi:prepilin-type N-terminal cleavage/methylation domain-containing protein